MVTSPPDPQEVAALRGLVDGFIQERLQLKLDKLKGDEDEVQAQRLSLQQAHVRETWLADAAKRVKSEWNSAAIAGDMAASLYGLTKLAEKIEDRPDNSTRFLIIGSQEVPPTGDDKTSVIVSMRNKPGALHELLVPFHTSGIDLTRIETRPSRSGKWTYAFFIDFVGHHRDPLISAVLEQINQEAVALKVLGSYPKAVL